MKVVRDEFSNLANSLESSQKNFIENMSQMLNEFKSREEVNIDRNAMNVKIHDRIQSSIIK